MDFHALLMRASGKIKKTRLVQIRDWDVRDNALPRHESGGAFMCMDARYPDDAWNRRQGLFSHYNLTFRIISRFGVVQLQKAITLILRYRFMRPQNNNLKLHYVLEIQS